MDDDTQKIFQVILAGIVEPNADFLTGIFLGGDIAVVVHQPDHSWVEALKGMGWDGNARVFPLRSSRAARTIGTADHVTAAWIQRHMPSDVGRIFVIARGRALLINYKPGEGYSVEPSSTEAARAAMAEAAARINAPFGGSA